MAQAAAVRGYTTGSVTSPLLVVPFSLCTRGRLRGAGVLRPTPAGCAGPACCAPRAPATSRSASRRPRRQRSPRTGWPAGPAARRAARARRVS
ncbi:HXXEE domain-containing protein [Streptomyces sp. NPDC005908]|uniref:HXXEE domain-containing protein n=1 Tax=Streptomyces sp. NPDC005908 TaxID=3157084 RepID=UPI0033F4333B